MDFSHSSVEKTYMNLLERARQVLHDEAESLQEVALRLDQSFVRAVELLWHCSQNDGRVAVTGVGKSADVAQKIVGTFNSTGTRAYLMDATRALHGDLGMIHRHDAVLVLSNSGESEEIVRLLKPLKEMADSVIALTGNKAGSLALQADAAIVYGPVVESSPFGLAPSTSATVAMSIGHALAFSLCELREFTDTEFARYHPAGSLGFKLSLVESHMRCGTELRMARSTDSVREVFAKARHRGRRTGAVMLVDEEGRLVGLFTDSDLARLFERRLDDAFDQPVCTVMTKSPLVISPRQKMSEAIEMMQLHKISELPVLDDEHRPIGLLDITDLLTAADDSPEEKPFLPRLSA
jgi:arabinose-5-phosphate isomerase